MSTALTPSTKLTPAEFVNFLYPYAKQTEKKTGINAVAILAQAALESGWNSASPGWMFFGVKDTDGINGNEQLLTTTEYSRSASAKFPRIQKVVPVIRNGEKWFKYTILDYFRKFNSPEESFTDHGQFFVKNKRYADAMKVAGDTDKFFDAIAKAGYATAPDYATTLKNMAAIIRKNMK